MSLFKLHENYKEGTSTTSPAEAGIVLAQRIEATKKQDGSECVVLKVTARDTKTHKVWRAYHPLPVADIRNETRLAHYAKGIILGLPRHDVLLKFAER